MGEDNNKKLNPIVHILTGKDNETHDLIKWLGVALTIAGIAFTGYDVYLTGHFDMQAYGLGATTLLVGIGTALKVKETTEPEAVKPE